MKRACVELPSECWELVFERLHGDHYQFLEAVSLVCKSFLSLSNPLLLSLTVSPHSVPLLPRLLRRFRQLKTIVVAEFCGDLNAILSQIAGSELRLQSLHLSHQKSVPVEGIRQLGSTMKTLKSLKCQYFGRLCDEDLIEISHSLPWLEELDISYSNVKKSSVSGQHLTDAGIEEMSRKLRQLRKIDVSGNQYFSDISVVVLSSNCVFLREIVLHSCCRMTPNGMVFALCNSANLVSVSVNGLCLHSPIFGCPLEFIENSFMHATALSAIKFSHTVITDALLCSIAKSNVQLKKLALYHCKNFTMMGLSSILHAHHQYLSEVSLNRLLFLTDQRMNDLSVCLSNVTSINLSECYKLTNSTFFILTKSCSSLTEIIMESTSLGNEELVVDLVKNYRVRSLKLAKNISLTNNSLIKFASVCPNLQLLDVSYCNGITGRGTAEILKSCNEVRHLEIIGCGGIKSLIETDSKLSKLRVLKAGGSGIRDEGLIMVAKTCPCLLHLAVGGFDGLSEKGLKEIVGRCKGLREIDIWGRLDFDPSFVAWMVSSGPSLRKIILPFDSFSRGKNQWDSLLRRGCLVHYFHVGCRLD